ncbi:hypothetical protein F53441_11092 [Fusarium austroafricanum]|uniref:Uncharacterized protein n=1 Tax=Fusarium austroafricanum TaxID=2364996 RepID=A0A8H4K742_9HYPO|nr:hypothetical protein F53441_11092 [Fusarium austroafricanum]
MEELLLTRSYFSPDYDNILCVGEDSRNPDAYCERSVALPGVIRKTTISGTITSLERKLANERATSNKLVTKSKDQETLLRQETLSWKKKYESLDHEAKVAEETSARNISNLEVKISSMENSFRRDQHEISAQKYSLSELRATKTKLEAQVQQSTTQLQELTIEKNGTNDEVRLLKTRLQQSTTQIQTLQTEKIKANGQIQSLQADLERLQIKMNNLEKSNELMAMELAAKDLSLKDEESHVKELVKTISNLEISEAQLKQVIASCWLHRIYTWFAGFRLVC